MRVTVLTPDLSGNCTGRAWLLARLLAERFEVELVGPTFRDDVWAPLAGGTLPVTAVPFGYEARHALRMGRIAEAIRGDVVVASKPLATSYGVALGHRRRAGTPVVLDIDDWESGFCTQRWRSLGPLGRLRYLASSVVRPHASLSLVNARRFEARAVEADALTVSNRFLQRRFGGELIWHVRELERFDPERQDPAATRARFGIPTTRRVVTFLGTITPYKGLELLVDAIAALGRDDTTLWLIGAGEDDAIVDYARERLGDALLATPPQPLDLAPQLLAAADVVVVPQPRNPATVGQMPAKLFDAMAAGRPTVATDVSDVAEVLGEGGWVVPPGDSGALAAAIGEALADPERAARRGALARARAGERYGWQAMRAVAVDAVLRAAKQPVESPVERG